MNTLFPAPPFPAITLLSCILDHRQGRKRILPCPMKNLEARFVLAGLGRLERGRIRTSVVVQVAGVDCRDLNGRRG